jgi:hypothetical protein
MRELESFTALLAENDLRKIALWLLEDVAASGLWADPNRPAMKVVPLPERPETPDAFSFNETLRQISALLAAEEEDDLKPLAELIRSDFPIHPRVRKIVADMLDPGPSSSAKRKLVLAPRRGAPPNPHPNEFALCYITFFLRLQAKRMKQAHSVVGELFSMSQAAVKKIYFESTYYRISLRHLEARVKASRQ